MKSQNTVENDLCFIWCTNNVEQLLPFKNGFVAVKLPEGIVASGTTQDEFEANINALSLEQSNNLYVTHAGIFFDDFKIPLMHWDYS